MKKKFNKNPTNENKTKFKKQRNKCVSIRRKAIKNHFKKATENGLLSNQAFWDLVKTFLSNKGALVGSDISIVRNGTIITDDQDLSELFNEYYVNIVDNTSGKKPCVINCSIRNFGFPENAKKRRYAPWTKGNQIALLKEISV